MQVPPKHQAGTHAHTHDYFARLTASFEALPSKTFAARHGKAIFLDRAEVHAIASSLSDAETLGAAGHIEPLSGKQAPLPDDATDEQVQEWREEAQYLTSLVASVKKYEEQFGIRFVAPNMAQSKAKDLLAMIKGRFENPHHVEWDNVRHALADIAFQRLQSCSAYEGSDGVLQALAEKHNVAAFQAALSTSHGDQCITEGANLTDASYFAVGALTHPIATAFAFDYFAKRDINLDAPVNTILGRTSCLYRLQSAPNVPAQWADQVTIRNLLRHTSGLECTAPLTCEPPIGTTLRAPRHMTAIEFLTFKGAAAVVARKPGSEWRYAHAGYAVIQLLIESLESSSDDISTPMRHFFAAFGAKNLTAGKEVVLGRTFAPPRNETGDRIRGAVILPPKLVAGMYGTATDMHAFVKCLHRAFKNLDGNGPISHDTARRMLYHPGNRKGKCFEAMGFEMGTGYYLLPADENDFIVYFGAVPGFRSLQVFCVDGPDSGKGFTLLASGQANAVKFTAMAARAILTQFDLHSFDPSMPPREVPLAKLDRIDGAVYSDLVFASFLPDRPEAIQRRRGDPKDARYMNNLLDGANVDFCTNDRFGRVENLISRFEPKYDPLAYGRAGKVTDAWESSRHNKKEFDFAVFRLKTPGVANYVFISTKWYTDNFVTPFVEIWGCDDPNERRPWFPIVPRTRLQAHSLLRIKLDHPIPVRRIKVHNIPDGGITRIKVYSELPDGWRSLYKPFDEAKPLRIAQAIPVPVRPVATPYTVDVEAAARFAARAKGPDANAASAVYGASLSRAKGGAPRVAQQILSPHPPLNQYDGVLTKRSRSGELNAREYIDVRLAWTLRFRSAVIDFTHFRNNTPVELQILGRPTPGKGEWTVLCTHRYVKHFAGTKMRMKADRPHVVGEVRVELFPCGGFNRISVFGQPQSQLPKPKAKL